MAIYRINLRTSIFQGRHGDLIETEPGPLMNAMVASGALSRMDNDATEDPADAEEKEPSGKSKKAAKGS